MQKISGVLSKKVGYSANSIGVQLLFLFEIFLALDSGEHLHWETDDVALLTILLSVTVCVCGVAIGRYWRRRVTLSILKVCNVNKNFSKNPLVGANCKTFSETWSQVLTSCQRILKRAMTYIVNLNIL